jgi:hypothetical protein
LGSTIARKVSPQQLFSLPLSLFFLLMVMESQERYPEIYTLLFPKVSATKSIASLSCPQRK